MGRWNARHRAGGGASTEVEDVFVSGTLLMIEGVPNLALTLSAPGVVTSELWRVDGEPAMQATFGPALVEDLFYYIPFSYSPEPGTILEARTSVGAGPVHVSEDYEM